jgi:cytochrome c oxidase cbb3-type subunit 3
MIAWEQTINKKEIQQLTSYILTLQGSTPERPKRPEGEFCTE